MWVPLAGGGAGLPRAAGGKCMRRERAEPEQQGENVSGSGVCGMVRSQGAVRGAAALSLAWGVTSGGRAFSPVAGGGGMPQQGVRLRAGGVAPAKHREEGEGGGAGCGQASVHF